MLSSPDATLDVALVTQTAGLEALRPEWERLWLRSTGATPFQSPAWLIPWWRHIGEGELLTLALRAHGALVGLLPFYVYAADDGRRHLFPLGIGTTDYLDALASPGSEAAVMATGFRQLAALADRFDIAEWPQLRPDATLLEAAPADWMSQVESGDICPATPLPPDLDTLGAVVSRKTLRDLRTARRRAAEAGALRWEDAGARDLDTVFDALLRLHTAQWERRGEAGVLAAPAVQAAHRAALPELLRAGLLRLQALHLDDAIVAALYALIDPPQRPARRVYLYISGFDPALDRLSPGMLLVGHAIEQAVSEGFAALDFLRGQERYKYFWGAEDEPTFRRTLRLPAGVGS
ncbi:GNAT family N-acetyltransferase [Plastoroseomonas hellenica]|uniref:GNAT family N-acetyltransferase n=1 Tax=Plastoroseomonas hellenica TaxID=2687306 RepID=UPI001BA5C662|nr:GNAT family N-acetyltransferase [Plastoroseomonas hellenica]MBR0645390.1 GNAT family N-acetyltransferase [Plastoroseomonas hellenica]